MYIEDRQNQILEILKHAGKVNVDELASRLERSPETIRRDLRKLEQFGMVKRFRGGAIMVEAAQNTDTEPPATFRQSLNIEKKGMIAKRAAEFIKNDDVLLLDDSTTVSHMLRYLPRNFSLTIITNSISVVTQLQSYNNDASWTTVCLGGILRSRSCSLTGFLALNTLSTFRPDKLFMSCGGVDVNGNLTEGNLGVVELKRQFLSCCKEKYLLLDDSKIGNPTPVNLCSMREIDYLIVSDLNSKQLERVKKMGAKAIVRV